MRRLYPILKTTGVWTLILSLIGCALNRSQVQVQQERESSSYYKLGLAYLSETPPSIQKAYVEFLKAVETDPKNVDAYYALGHVYAERQEYEKGVETFKKLLVLDPGHSKARNYLGNIYEMLGRDDEAIEAYRAALNDIQYETPQLPRWKLGHLYLRRGQYEKALLEFQAAHRIEPENVVVMHQIGDTYMKMEQPDRARLFFEKAAKMAPNDYRTHDRLGKFYMERGLFVEAGASFQRVMELAPESAEAKEAKRMLARMASPDSSVPQGSLRHPGAQE